MTAMLGKVVLITGSTSGIGLEAAKQFYQLGATVLMTCRDEIRGRKALDALLSKESAITASGDQQRVHLYTLDLMCYKSIITFCKDVLSDWRHIDDLVLNAGIMGKSFELSSDGIESHFATNMFGHYVIVNQLYELLSNGDVPSRVIVVSSGFYTNSPPIPSMKKLMGEEHWENYNSKHCYAISKLANCLYVKHLSQKFRHHGDKVQIFAVRPGFIGATELGRETHWLLRLLGSPLIWLVSQPVTKGVEPIVHLATNDLLELKSGGLYNNDCREEDYTTAVNLVDAANLFHLLYEMENTVLKRSRLEPQEIDMVKTRREWFV